MSRLGGSWAGVGRSIIPSPWAFKPRPPRSGSANAAAAIISPKLNRTRPVVCACDLEDGDSGTNVIIALSTVANRRHRPSGSPRDSLLLSQPRRDRHVSWGYSSVNVTLALLLI